MHAVNVFRFYNKTLKYCDWDYKLKIVFIVNTRLYASSKRSKTSPIIRIFQDGHGDIYFTQESPTILKRCHILFATFSG